MNDWLSTVRGQDVAVATLRRALAAGRVHHAYLFDGPDGVGKERTALGLAQALVCERREAAPGAAGAGRDRACGVCSACVRAVVRPGEDRPVHPDVVMIARGLYEPAQIGRRTQETQEISIDQVRTLVLARAAFAPHEGRAKVVIVRAADELSISAANALLKTLEEPGPRTHFVLLTSQADALLPTIRSRTLRLRFGALPDDVVADLLAARGVDAPNAAAIARLAGGSLRTADVLADPERSAAREAFVARALAALDAPDLGAALDLAEDAKKKKKDLLPLDLVAFAGALAERARTTTRGAPKTRDAGAAAAGSPRTAAAETDAARYRVVLAALRELDANGAAQLVVESMFGRMRAI